MSRGANSSLLVEVCIYPESVSMSQGVDTLRSSVIEGCALRYSCEKRLARCMSKWLGRCVADRQVCVDVLLGEIGKVSDT